MEGKERGGWEGGKERLEEREGMEKREGEEGERER